MTILHRPRRFPRGAGLALALLAAGCASAHPAPAPPPPPPGAEAHHRAAETATADPAAALPLFEDALRAAPDDLRYGADYRQAVIAAGAYDRAIDFFASLVAEHPEAVNLRLNQAFAFVDKIPAAGSVTAVILANKSIETFTAALDLRETWLGLYSRGNAYVYWPPIFHRTKLGIADLEKAIELAGQGPKEPYQARAWAALGDAYWRLKDLETARKTWREGLEHYPGTPYLERRLALDDDALDDFLGKHYQVGSRVDTSLHELWESP
jgi:tetratricopeptide (TPR) repeat protein